MKTYLFGVLSGILLSVAWKYRSVLIPWLKEREGEAVDALKKK